MTRPSVLMADPFPDCKTAAEALSLLSGAILAVPADAIGIDWSFGKRHDGNWYWGVRWTLSAGSAEQRPRFVDKQAQLAKATDEALRLIADEQALTHITGRPSHTAQDRAAPEVADTPPEYR